MFVWKCVFIWKGGKSSQLIIKVGTGNICWFSQNIVSSSLLWENLSRSEEQTRCSFSEYN